RPRRPAVQPAARRGAAPGLVLTKNGTTEAQRTQRRQEEGRAGHGLHAPTVTPPGGSLRIAFSVLSVSLWFHSPARAAGGLVRLPGRRPARPDGGRPRRRPVPLPVVRLRDARPRRRGHAAAATGAGALVRGPAAAAAGVAAGRGLPERHGRQRAHR